jgi:hypothetical protein
MKTENLSIGLRALYHAIEWLTVFLILLIFAVQIITPLYAVRVGRADTFLQQLQWLPYRPGVLALGVMLAAVGTILSKCSHEVDSGFLSRSSWQLYLLEGVLYSASALIFQQNCDKIALFAIVDMVDDPRSLRQKRFLSAMIVVYLFCNMDAATSALHAVTLKQYLAFYSLHTRSVLQLVIESLSALEMILFILYMVLFISQQTSEKQEILNLNQQLQQANEQLRIYAEESAHTAQVPPCARDPRHVRPCAHGHHSGRRRLHPDDGRLARDGTAPDGADSRHRPQRNERCPALGQGTAAGLAGKRKPLGGAQQDVYQHGAEQRRADPAGRVAGRADTLAG